MIRTALEFVQKILDSFIADREQDTTNYRPGNIVDLNAFAQPSGTSNLNENYHITMMLIGIEEERREGKRPQFRATDDKQFLKLNAPVELELSVLFAAHKPDYVTALRDISDVAAFFQANPVFDELRFPALNNSVTQPALFPWRLIERLSCRLHNLSFEQQNNLWSLLGLKYMPSVLYKINMLTVFDQHSNDKSPAIKELSINEKP